jgi:hypothetical protein
MYRSTFSWPRLLDGIVGDGVQLGSLGTAATNGLLCQPRVIMIIEKLVELLAGETEVLGENLPQCCIVHHKPHMLPGREPGPPRWESQRLTAWAYGTAFDLGTSWRWVVSFTSLLVYPRGRSPRYPVLVWTAWRRENSWPYLYSNSDPSVVQPLYRLSYSVWTLNTIFYFLR